MDEGTLNDLLECSVCLDRLDTSSKVLPCQHTFCRKCLQEIVHKHKELRCPECRVLVTSKIEDLPPNVLLMRILEGMKNSGVVPPKRSQKPSKPPSQHHQAFMQQYNSQTHQHTQYVDRSNNKHSLSPSVPHQSYAKALYNYTPSEAGDLSFKKGDIITLKRKIDSQWYQGECAGKLGVFPLSYVQIITPVPSHTPQCKALYDFRMNNDEEEGCLVFNKGDVINVIRRVDENWAEGKLDDRIGIFPMAFVEMNSLARSLMKLSTNAQPGPSKVAPPTPTAEDSTPLIPTDHTTSVVAQNVPQPVSDSSCNSSSTTPNVSSSNTSSGSSTTPSSPASPPARVDNAAVLPHNLGSVQRHSAEIVQPSSATSTTGSERSKRSADLQLPAAFMALYPYKPQKSDELELKKGGIYMVSEMCQDGWYKGTSNRTQKCGVFPGNYVTPARGAPGTPLSVPADSKLPVSFTRGTRNRLGTADASVAPPELPPRSNAPPVAGWLDSPARTNSSTNASKSDKASRERKDKGTVGLMRRLASMKRSKSPPASSYSMDNPVFEDSCVNATAALAAPVHPVHVRSGSCPSQLLQIQPPPTDHHRLFGSASHRVKHKERPTILSHGSSRSTDLPQGGSSESSPDVHRHRKSHSLDATAVKSSKTSTQTVRERFRCITPYPPNSDYELELQVNDIIYVHKKREDGWYKGTQQRTGKTGLFPASFVESF